MIQENKELINLKAIRFEVDNLELSIAFFRKLGCFIEEVKNSNHTISAYISFNNDSTTMIHLLKDFRRTELLTQAEKAPVFELAAIEGDDRGFPEVFQEVYQNGVKYSNVDPETNIPIVAQFMDESGHNWELIDDFDYLAIKESN